MSEFAEPPLVSISHNAVETAEAAPEIRRDPLTSGSRAFHRWLVDPRIDKALAIVAVAPFAYPLSVHLRMDLTAWKFLYLAQTLVLIGTMVLRRPPVRITTNPYYWMLAFVATYWGLLVLSLAQRGRPITNSRLVILLYPLAIFIEIWGRLSLGRNIGMLPAQREIVVRGAYRWVRHPIYTALFPTVIAGALRSFSPRNLILLALAIVWCVARTLAEENFLQKDPVYAEYMKRVRWRWFPGVI
jgi:protein-S-isoprenylcysteine O-methyltransferase Ste14